MWRGSGACAGRGDHAGWRVGPAGAHATWRCRRASMGRACQPSAVLVQTVQVQQWKWFMVSAEAAARGDRTRHRLCIPSPHPNRVHRVCTESPQRTRSRTGVMVWGPGGAPAPGPPGGVASDQADLRVWCCSSGSRRDGHDASRRRTGNGTRSTVVAPGKAHAACDRRAASSKRPDRLNHGR